MKTRETTITQKHQSQFWRTKEFLYRVRDARRRIDLLERRIAMSRRPSSTGTCMTRSGNVWPMKRWENISKMA